MELDLQWLDDICPQSVVTAMAEKVDGLSNEQDLVGLLFSEEGRDHFFPQIIFCKPELVWRCGGVHFDKELSVGVLQFARKDPVLQHIKNGLAHLRNKVFQERTNKGVAVSRQVGQMVHNLPAFQSSTLLNQLLNHFQSLQRLVERNQQSSHRHRLLLFRFLQSNFQHRHESKIFTQFFLNCSTKTLQQQ